MTKVAARWKHSVESNRRHRTPAIASILMLALVWVPCFACESMARADDSPRVANLASCHAGEDSDASTCAPQIRAAEPALLGTGAPPMGPVFAPIRLAAPRPLAYVATFSKSSRSEPAIRPPLYLLHEVLLA